MTGARIILVGLIATLAGCAGYERDITLRDMRTNQRSPQEFSVLPVKPLQTPTDTTLPQPTPGGSNRTDPTPNADAVAVLGGNPARLTVQAGTIGAGDGGLVSHVSRFGRDPNIRADLAATDLEFRRRRSIFTWSIVPRDEYTRAYRGQMLDPYFEADRWARAGARVPSNPPAP